MSNLSIHDTTSENYSNTVHSRIHANYSRTLPFHITPGMSQPETQAQLVAFTPPLMSVPWSHSDSRVTAQNNFTNISSVQNHLKESSSMNCHSQPEYYVDSFASNFSDNPPSNSNNNNKTKTKHVTFQEPELTKLVIIYFSLSIILHQ